MTTDIIYTGELYSATQKLIEHSEKEIIIISPWFDFQGHIKETLVSRINAGVKITVITRKSDTPQHKGAISYVKNVGQPYIMMMYYMQNSFFQIENLQY